MGIPLMSRVCSAIRGAPPSMGSPRPLKTRPNMSRDTGRVCTLPRKRTFVSFVSMPEVPSKTCTSARSDSISRTRPRRLSPLASSISASSS